MRYGKLINKTRKLSKKATRFFSKHKYKKGTYKELQKTKIWNDAKNLYIRNNKEYYGLLKCHFCKKPINGNGVLHHMKYWWKDLFHPKTVCIICKRCHSGIYYRNKKPTKKLVM